MSARISALKTVCYLLLNQIHQQFLKLSCPQYFICQTQDHRALWNTLIYMPIQISSQN